MPETNGQPNADGTDSQSNKISYGAPSGPRKKLQANYDGREPLEFPGHEAAALFLAFPEALREFKSIAALARHFNITRVTVYRWLRDFDVMKRADYLSLQNKIAGNLIARREYVPIMERAAEMAKGGNIKAMEFCADRGFPEDKQSKKSGISSPSLEEVLERSEREHIKHGETMTATWLKERAKRLASRKPPAPALSYVEPPTPNAEPAPEASPVNSCDACGSMRCTHGRCPMCEICPECG